MKIKSNAVMSKAFLTDEQYVSGLKQDIIRLNKNGQFFTATFIKKDGTERRMTARIGVTKHLRGGGKGYDYNHLLTVWDAGTLEYRTINLRTLKRLRMRGQTVEFK